MPFPVLTFEQIRSNLLRDLKNYRPDADVTTDSDFYVRATSVASAVEGLYQHQAWMVRQIFPDTADREYLYMHAAVRGLAVKQAVPARGSLRISGQPGAFVPEGVQARRADGALYRTTADDYIPLAGTGTFAAEAVVAGIVGNADDDTPVTLQVSPAGLDSAAKLLSMRGGVSQESDGALLARLLDLIRRPPAGGNRHDYRRWAMEVEGVSDAYVYPLRRGLGTVDVAIVSGEGLPSQDTINRVKDYIEDVRPVTAKGCLIVAPSLRYVDMVVRVSLRDTTIDQAREAIRQSLQAQFLQIAPGMTWVRSQSEALISNVAGVVDRAIAWPVSNIAPVVNGDIIEWLRLGVIQLELLP